MNERIEAAENVWDSIRLSPFEFYCLLIGRVATSYAQLEVTLTQIVSEIVSEDEIIGNSVLAGDKLTDVLSVLTKIVEHRVTNKSPLFTEYEKHKTNIINLDTDRHTFVHNAYLIDSDKSAKGVRSKRKLAGLEITQIDGGKLLDFPSRLYDEAMAFFSWIDKNKATIAPGRELISLEMVNVLDSINTEYAARFNGLRIVDAMESNLSRLVFSAEKIQQAVKPQNKQKG